MRLFDISVTSPSAKLNRPDISNNFRAPADATFDVRSKYFVAPTIFAGGKFLVVFYPPFSDRFIFYVQINNFDRRKIRSTTSTNNVYAYTLLFIYDNFALLIRTGSFTTIPPPELSSMIRKESLDAAVREKVRGFKRTLHLAMARHRGYLRTRAAGRISFRWVVRFCARRSPRDVRETAKKTGAGVCTVLPL